MRNAADNPKKKAPHLETLESVSEAPEEGWLLLRQIRTSFRGSIFAVKSLFMTYLTPRSFSIFRFRCSSRVFSCSISRSLRPSKFLKRPDQGLLSREIRNKKEWKPRSLLDYSNIFIFWSNLLDFWSVVRSICEPMARSNEPKPPLPPDNFNWTVIMVFGGNEVRRLDGTVAQPFRKINEPLFRVFVQSSESQLT